MLRCNIQGADAELRFYKRFCDNLYVSASTVTSRKGAPNPWFKREGSEDWGPQGGLRTADESGKTAQAPSLKRRIV